MKKMTEMTLTIEGELGEDLTYDELMETIRDQLSKAGIVEYSIRQITPLQDSVVVSVEIEAYKELPKKAAPKGKAQKPEPDPEENENETMFD